MIFPPFSSPYIGGIVSHSEEFAQAFAAQGFKITLFVPQLASLPQLQSVLNIRRVYYPAIEIILHFPFPKIWTLTFWRAFGKLNRSHYDCIFSRTRFFPITFVAFVYAKIKKIPWVHIEHGTDHMQRLGTPTIKLFSRLYDATIGYLVFHCADSVIAIAPSVRDFLKKFGRTDVQVIYRGLDCDAYKNIPTNYSMRTRFPNKILIMWAGRMSRWKGVHNSIEALALLPQTMRDRIVFVLVGDGEERTRLQQLGKGLPVIFSGSLSRETVIGLLKSSDIFIHSSYEGGALSTALLEAMFCKNAIIATPHEGAPEVIHQGSTGLLTDNNSPKSISKCLQALLTDPHLRHTLGQSAHDYVQKNFSWNETVNRYLEVIKILQR